MTYQPFARRARARVLTFGGVLSTRHLTGNDRSGVVGSFVCSVSVALVPALLRAAGARDLERAASAADADLARERGTRPGQLVEQREDRGVARR